MQILIRRRTTTTTPSQSQRNKRRRRRRRRRRRIRRRRRRTYPPSLPLSLSLSLDQLESFIPPPLQRNQSFLSVTDLNKHVAEVKVRALITRLKEKRREISYLKERIEKIERRVG